MTTGSCPNCGEPLAADGLNGLCGRCLLRAGLPETAPAGEYSPPTPEELAPLFPNLEILDLLGGGGMGFVFQARQPALDRLVALKILPRELSRDPAFVERFAREARALARLDHPNIVGVYDSGVAGGYCFLVMEYVDGSDLRRAMRDRPLGPAAALRLVAEVCDGLSFAHAAQIVHRDIKPDNILLTGSGTAKIADFGLAKLLHQNSGEALTSTSQVLGTRHYMAPEQQEGGAVDHRADIYSLGVVCYELLTGEMPLGRFAPPSAKGAVDRRVDAVVLKALAREPSRRHQSADEMKRHLIAATRRRRLPWAIIASAAVVLLAAALLIPRMFAPAPAEALFRWGGDAEGGAPYIIESDNHKQPTGFEAELAEYLGAKLNLRPRFVQRSWDQLPEDLRRGTDIDVILNGYEWTPEREQMMASTIPYYVGKIVLVVRKDSPISGWEDLHRDRSGKTLTVGVLSESASHRYLREHYRTQEGSSDRELEIQDKSGDAITGFLDKVAKKDGMDATVLDVPAARYYVEQEKGNVRGAGDLKILWPAIEPTYNVVYCRTGDRVLRERINDALREALRDGTLKRIYEKWGLWDDDQKELLVLSEHWPPQVEASSRTMLDHAWLLLRAAGVTVELACISMPLAMALGLLVAVGRLYGPRLLGWPLAVYVEVLRGTPLLMQLLAIYYLLPYAGLHFSGFWAAVLALAVNYSAYEAENYRAGLLAVSGGQMEAALALGMSRFQALRYVIVPQAVRLVVPPVTNDFIALFKDTSICSVIMVYELAKQYQSLVANFPQRGLELGLATAALYLAMSWPLSLLARRLEARSSRN